MKTRSITHASALAAVSMLIALGLSGCAAWSYVGYSISPDYPADEDQTLSLPGLEAPVTVLLDAYGVAHIKAEHEADLMRAVGYMHGRDRFFQMDTLRRFARGRLSELVGEQQLQFGSSVELDATMRGWGFEALSAQDADELEGEARTLMEAYVAGVELARKRHPPIEYRLLGIEPEPWTLADSFAVGRLVGWSISHNWHQELCRLVLALHVGAERAEQIYGNEPWPGNTSVTPPGETRALKPAIAPQLRAMLTGRPAAAPGPRSERALAATLSVFGAASNAWVIQGSRTTSGKPLLANDPHMSHTLPSLMVQQHLVSGDLDVIGVTAPGLPYILIGHNRRVAWGMTSAVGDVIDLYVEKPDPADPAKVLGPNGPQALVTEEMIVRVRHGDTFEQRRHRLRSTPRGPLVNDLYPKLLPEGAPLVSLRWDNRGAGGSIAAFRRANLARDVASLRQSLLGVVSPVNSIMAADVEGTVALFPTGRLPKRKGHRGTFPAPAWLADYDWDGEVARDEMPIFTAPAEGFFAHGNNLMYPPGTLPVLMQIDSAPAYRLDRISELIRAQPTLGVDDMKRIQADVVLLRARRLLPAIREDLAGLAGLLPREGPARRLLQEWDATATADSAAAAVFFVTYREAMMAAIVDEVDEDGFDYLMSERYFTNAADLWFDRADHPVWDDRRTPQVERRADVVRAAFRRAVAWLRENQGSDPAGWRWGALHAIQQKHPFGAKLPAFNLPRLDGRGGPDSVAKAHLDLGNRAHPFQTVAGPVYRMIVDLADPAHGWWIIDTGASGWPGSPHYADQRPLWYRGEYAPMEMDWQVLSMAPAATLNLKPE